MATETEIDRLVVRMVGDNGDFVGMMKESEQVSERTAKEVQQTSQKVEESGKALEGFARSVVGAVTSYLGASQLKGFFDAFTVQEQAEMRLRAALETNGRQVNSLFQDYAAFASELQNVTTQGDEVTLVMLQQAEAMGMTGDAAKDAVKAAVALSQSLNKSGDEVLRAIAKFNSGDLNALNEMFPVLRSITDESEKVAKAQELMAGQMAIAQSIALSASGQVTQLNNSWGDFKEQLGAVVAEGVGPVVSELKDLVAFLQQMDPEIRQAIVVTGALAVGITGLSAAYGLTKLALGPMIALMKTQIVVTNTLTASTRAATVATLALRAALIGGLVIAFTELTKEITGANEALEEFEEGIEQTQQLDKEMFDLRSRRLEVFVEEAQALTDVNLRARAFREELARAEKESKSLRDNLIRAQQAVEESDTGGRRLPLFGFGAQAEYNLLVQNAKSIQDAFDLSVQAVERLRGELRAVTGEARQKVEYTAFEDLLRFTNRLQFEIEGYGFTLQEATEFLEEYRKKNEITEEVIKDMADAFGLAGHEAGVFTEIVGKGLVADPVQFQAIIDALDMIEGRRSTIDIMQEMEEAVKGMSTAVESLRSQRIEEDLLGRPLSEAEKKVIDLHSQILAIPGVDIEVLKSFSEMAKEIKKSSGELLEQQRIYDLLGKSRDLIDSLKTADERYAETVKELNEMLDRNFINQNQYNEALARAKEQLDNATGSARELRQELEKLEGTLAGTADAQFRIAEYREAIGLPRQDPGRMPQGPNQPLNLLPDRPRMPEIPLLVIPGGEINRDLIEAAGGMNPNFNPNFNLGVGNQDQNVPVGPLGLAAANINPDVQRMLEQLGQLAREEFMKRLAPVNDLQGEIDRLKEREAEIRQFNEFGPMAPPAQQPEIVPNLNLQPVTNGQLVMKEEKSNDILMVMKDIRDILKRADSTKEIKLMGADL